MSSFALVTHNKKILLLLRDNNPKIMNPDTWCLIGGTEEKGETPQETFIRELKEETNLDPKPLTLLYTYPSESRPGITNYMYHMELTDSDIPKIQLGDEGQKLKFFTFSEMKDIDIAPSVRKHLEEHQKIVEQVFEG